ncbi:isopeptide-forming domain-containing fimbrial protein, partial [Microbulbifer litoralis]|uniref:isopeptide-forming domain-containing fimbrial protein n=1 Tax=Microbulbifer litoralis TaxID=2933965 RepID=UPI00202881AB
EFSCTDGNPFVCTLPSGTPTGSYTLLYTATVNSDALEEVTNSAVATGGGNGDPECEVDCDLEIPVSPEISYEKSASPASAQVGDTITYIVTTTVANATTDAVFTLTDTLGTGLALDAITAPGNYTCDVTNALECTLPSGTAPGTYTVTYTATITPDAGDSVLNVVVGNGSDDEDPECSADCDVETLIAEPAVTYHKSSDATGEVEVGDTIAYTLTARIETSQIAADLVLEDTLGTGLAFVEFIDSGDYDCTQDGQLLNCTLAAGATPGSYQLTYTAEVTEQASEQVSNVVVASGGDGNPTCTENAECDVVVPVVRPSVTYHKSTETERAAVGDTITYTLNAVIGKSALGSVFVLTDTLGDGLDFGEVTDTGNFTCTNSNPLECELPIGTVPGTYALSYTATVNGEADGPLNNIVVGRHEDPRLGDPPATCGAACEVQVPLIQPEIVANKSADPASGTELAVGQTIEYTVAVEVSGSATIAETELVDTPDAGLTIDTLPDDCTVNGPDLRCTLPSGTPVGVYNFTYSATVNPNAGNVVGNQVTVRGGGDDNPECPSCTTEHTVEAPEIRLVKTSNVGEVQIGDLLVYTLTAENLGSRDLVDGSIQDTPPPGFSYVEDSLQVLDADGFGGLLADNPLRIGDIDIPAGEIATITYVMRVGAAVRPGAHTNVAQVLSPSGVPVSNEATNDVVLLADPMTQESLIVGQVYNDRDGDGSQDSALLSGVEVRGGFTPGAYIAGSTSVNGRPEPDASAPLLHGIAIGSVHGLQSEADSADNHQVAIRQLLREPAFTDDFAMTSDQGFDIYMDANGQARVVRSGDAAAGRSAATPHVERRVAKVAEGYLVEYIITNSGIEEGGIPGVRIATPDGLLVETDQFGRYHLAGIDGGTWEFGRNLILKVDPSTLPAGSVFTTGNPLIRRVTPGMPVRFDFGVHLPEVELNTGNRQVQMELGEVLFAPGSTEVREEYSAVIDTMADTVRAHKGGEVVIQAEGISNRQAFARAAAVRKALLERLSGPDAEGLQVRLHTETRGTDTLVAGLTGEGTELGTLLFDTGKASIRPEFLPLLDQVAETIAASGDGRLTIVGHADRRGSPEYNSELGMRRAAAVYRALMERLHPDLKEDIRVGFVQHDASKTSDGRGNQGGK